MEISTAQVAFLHAVERCHTQIVSEPSNRYSNSHWHVAVWSLRIGYGGLFVAAVGLVLSLTGHTSWVLAAGVIWWLITVVITLTAFLWARHDMGAARPDLWSMRMMLVRDSLATGMRA